MELNLSEPYFLKLELLLEYTRDCQEHSAWHIAGAQFLLVTVLPVFASFWDGEVLKGRAVLSIFAPLPLGSVSAPKCLMGGWVEGQ